MKKVQRPARVVVVGQGYVGLRVAQAAVHAGHDVVGLDDDHDRVLAIAERCSAVADLTSDQLLAMHRSGRYQITDDDDGLVGFDVALITVPTPLLDGRPDLSLVLAAANTVAHHLTPGALVILESTVAPGTTDGEFTNALEKNPHGLGVASGDFQVGYSPERIDPGNPGWQFTNTPKLVSGVDAASCEAIFGFYSTMCDTVVRCQDTVTAEMAKLLENVYRSVNIALVNELSRYAHGLGCSIWRVIEAAKTKPYGYQPFYPGPGVGGHCLPVDPVYLSDQVERATGRRVELIDSAIRINRAQPAYVVDRVAALLQANGTWLGDARVLLLGVAYKRNTGDLCGAPALWIIEHLRELGCRVSVYDPIVVGLTGVAAARFPQVKVLETGQEMLNVARVADLTVLLTDHDDLPYDQIAEAAGLIFDTRNRLGHIAHVHTL